MKKILTLFAMLLVTVSTILAQQSDQHPKLTYQLVVRNNTNATVGEFAPNDLVYNANVEGKLSITGTTYEADFTGKTNMNGMLSLTIVDESYEGPDTNVVKLPVNSLRKINWKGSKIVVEIASYGIHEMEVLPVPYALNALNHDTLLTTLAITNYLKDINEEDVNQVIAAFFANEYPIAQYSQDTLVNYIKAHRTAIKNLILHFLGKVNTDDVADAYQAYKANTKLDSAVVDTVKKYIINNYDVAKEIGLAYIGQIDTNDVRRVLNAVNENPQFDDIVSILADSTLKYLSNHKQLVWKALKKFLDAVTVDEIDYAYNYFKTNRSADSSDLYPHMRSELDALVQAYLDENGYLKKCSTDPEFDICNIAARIENLENNPNFIKCPDLGQPTHPQTENFNRTADGASIPVTSTIKNIPDAETYTLNVSSDSVFFILSYPSTIFKNDTISGHVNIPTEAGQDTTMTGTINSALLNKADTILVQAVLKTKCTPMDAQYSAYDTISFSPVSCPEIVWIKKTSETSVDELSTNRGIKLTAQVDKNYKSIQKVGFTASYVDYDGTTPKIDTLYAQNGVGRDKEHYNQFTSTLGMKYCSKNVTVKAFVSCVDSTSFTFSDSSLQFKVRGPQVVISSNPGDSTYVHLGRATADSLILTAKSQMEVGSNASQCHLSAGTYTIEMLMQKCSDLISGYGIENPTYNWMLYDGTTKLNSDTLRVIPPQKDTTYVAWMEMNYLGQSCKVYDTIRVKYKNFTCGDTMHIQGNKYGTSNINGTCFMKSNMRNTKDSLGVEIVLGAESESSTITNGTAKYYKPSVTLNYSEEQLGLLYNHAAASTVCPKGWHLPSHDEWLAMEHYIDTLGGTPAHTFKDTTISRDGTTFQTHRTTYAKYLTAGSWFPWPDGVQGNKIGFDAYPAGVRHSTTLVPRQGFWSYSLAAFWTSTEGQNATTPAYWSHAFYSDPNNQNVYILAEPANHVLGFSVRCVQDGSSNSNSNPTVQP